MRVVLFGATGMVGAGVLLECLDSARVSSVLAIVRGSTGVRHAKLREIVHRDFLDFDSLREEFVGVDACFFCLGVSSFRMKEPDYRRITHDVTLAAASALLAQSRQLTFVYVSGDGTDSTARGRTMWARVKGETENDLLAMPFKAAYMFRPGYIQPLRGVRSRTGVYQAMYDVLGFLYPLLRRTISRHVTTTVNVGRAMIEVAAEGYPRPILASPEINALAEVAAARDRAAGASATSGGESQ